MNGVLRKSIAGLVLAASVATVAAPADAQRWRRHHRGDNDAGWAIGAGILGLGIGAAIASSNRRGYDRYDRGYYRGDYYGDRYYGDSYYGGDRYSRNSYYDDGYYDRGYYGRGYRDRYRGDCYTRRVYDPYLGRRVRVRYCN